MRENNDKKCGSLKINRKKIVLKIIICVEFELKTFLKKWAKYEDLVKV